MTLRMTGIVACLVASAWVSGAGAAESTAGEPAAAAAAAQPCGSIGIFNIAYGPGVPYQSAQVSGNACYCGAKDGVSPQQAQKNGWYASCADGQCVCNFSPGTIASNACCGPFQCQEYGFPTLTFGANVPYKSALMIGGQCYCGAKAGVSPSDAMNAGWYASCSSGKCICNFTAGTHASNMCCKP